MPITIEEETTDARSNRIVQAAPGDDPLAYSAPAVMTPAAMLSRAVEQGQSIEVLTKLMDLEERWQANRARQAFNEAFAAFKAEAVRIVRNTKITDGPLKNKTYADLHAFVDAVTPALSKHGLSASWAITKDEEKWIEVTCTVEHVLGHTRKVSMGGPPDAGGAKNQIHARASTVSYLERYTLKAVCGLAEQGEDNDAGPAKGPITTEEAETIREMIRAANVDEERFLNFMGASTVEEIRDYDRAVTALQKKARANG